MSAKTMTEGRDLIISGMEVARSLLFGSVRFAKGESARVM